MNAATVASLLAGASGVALAAGSLDINGWLLSSEFLSVLATAISSLVLTLLNALFFGATTMA